MTVSQIGSVDKTVRLATSPGRPARASTPRTYDVVVIGAGPAGVSAAVRAAELGARTVLVEAARVGGTCVNTGCVPTRLLARTVRVLRDARTAGDFGVEVPAANLVWARTAARVRAAIEEVHTAKDIASRLDAAGVHLITQGRARFIDPHTIELAGSGLRLSGAAFVIATGGSSRTLPIEGIELTTVAERIVDLDALPASVAIIGSGATGSQLATVFSGFGVAVTLLELADRVLPGADRDVSHAIEAAFIAVGVDVRTGIGGIRSVHELGDGRRRVVLTGPVGKIERHVDAELVVVCAGWPARLDGLGLAAAGVRTTRTSIPVDAHQRTNVAHIFVAGDADGEAQLVQAGEASGIVAATNAVVGARTGSYLRTDHSVLPAGGFTDPDYGQVGLTEDQALARHPGALSATVPYARVDRAVIDQRTTGFLKLVSTPDNRRLLGAHAVGEEALEVIQAVAVAMAAGADVATLASMEFAYPTYTSIIGLAAAALLRTGADLTVRQPA
ncbi:dihydrolipoyl dehydrogenase family protein [Pengzhenrongella phosphoraccumulans]|uniref:dihydrolipoyl dehydrogenase family protein n=1 Tax=Pengzhenrongella phosphoraccumulans TaxID=3114394 RepID=UPI00388F00EA